ncbi:unnamed protein product, partial [Brachionus calyciflorus]
PGWRSRPPTETSNVEVKKLEYQANIDWEKEQENAKEIAKVRSNVRENLKEEDYECLKFKEFWKKVTEKLIVKNGILYKTIDSESSTKQISKINIHSTTNVAPNVIVFGKLMTSSVDRLCGIDRTSVNQDENFVEKIQDKMPLVNNRSISMPNINNENLMNVNSTIQPVIVEIDVISKPDELNLDPNQPLNLKKIRLKHQLQEIYSINESRLNKNLSESQLEASSDESEKSEDELVANVFTAEEAKHEMDLPTPDEDGWLTCNFKNCVDRFATPFGLKVQDGKMHKVKFVESKIQASSSIITPTHDNENLAAVGSIENLNASTSGTLMDIMYKITIENMPNLYNSWRSLKDLMDELVLDRNRKEGKNMSRDVSVRVAKVDGPITSAFVSADDLADNEWLLEKLDGYNFNDLVEFRANPNRECNATDERLEIALTQWQERFKTLNSENHRLREQVEEKERE